MRVYCLAFARRGDEALRSAGRPVPSGRSRALPVRTLCRRGPHPGLRECSNRLKPVVFQAGLKAGLCPAPASSGSVCPPIALLLAHYLAARPLPPVHASGDGATPPETWQSKILAQGNKNKGLLNEIKVLSFRAKIELIWNAKRDETPVQLTFLKLNYRFREE